MGWRRRLEKCTQKSNVYRMEDRIMKVSQAVQLSSLPLKGRLDFACSKTLILNMIWHNVAKLLPSVCATAFSSAMLQHGCT